MIGGGSRAGCDRGKMQYTGRGGLEYRADTIEVGPKVSQARLYSLINVKNRKFEFSFRSILDVTHNYDVLPQK